MPQDYNIYIHSTDGGNVLATKTTPFANLQETNNETTPFQAIQTGLNKAVQFSSSGFSGALSTGVAALSKVFPAVAIVMIGLKIADKVITTGSQIYEQYSGSYQFSMEYNNFKTSIGNVINPIGFLMYQQNRNAEFYRNNVKIEQQRTLIGNSYSSLGRRGV